MFRSPHSEGAGLWADSRGEEGQWTRSTARLSLLLLLLLLCNILESVDYHLRVRGLFLNSSTDLVNPRGLGHLGVRGVRAPRRKLRCRIVWG